MEGRHEGEYSELLESYQTLPCAEVPVILHDEVLMAMIVLLRNVKKYMNIVNIEADSVERWIEAPESDDDESPLVAVLAECEEPSRQDACDDDSVEVKAMSLQTWKARAAAAELMLFLEEN